METVLFDMDGTLLDTLDDLTASVNYAFGRAGLPLVTREQTREAAGYASVALIDTLSGHRYPVGSAEFEELWSGFVEHYGEHGGEATRPYAGIPELLGTLSERGVAMAVVSNKMHDDTERLRQQWFAQNIAAAVGFSRDVPRKPAPDMARMALEKLGRPLEGTVYVGDSQPDVQLAKNLGCTSVAVTWGFRHREILEAEHPDFIVDTPQDLLSVLEGIWADA